MLDLFATGGSAPPSLVKNPDTLSPEKNSLDERGGEGTPKNFQARGGNSDQLVAPPKNHPDLCKKLQADSSDTPESKMPLERAKTPLEAKPKESKGKGTRKKYKRVSALVKPPSEEALIAEGCVVEDADDPRRTDKWREEWHPRARHPAKRGRDANINAIHLVESRLQVPKPDVIDWREQRAKEHKIPWKEVEPDILKFVSAGGTLAAYGPASGLANTAISKHIRTTPEFREKLAEARRIGADALAAEALAIASTPMMTEERITVYDKNDELVTKSVKLSDNTYARKLAFSARMQLLEKWAPDKYGPNAKAEDSGGMAEKLRAARERIRSDLRASRHPKSADAS